VSAPRVAYVLRAFPRLSETFILRELLALRERGVAVRVFALERDTRERMHPEAERMLPEVTFVDAPELTGRRAAAMARAFPSAVPAKQLPFAAAGERIGRELQVWGATHVHAHFAGPAATAAAFAARTAGIAYSFTAHAKDIFVDSLDWKWLAWLGAHAHAVVTVCDYNRRFLRRRMPGARIVRIYNGVDLERWKPAARANPAGPIVTAGRFVKKKGFGVLVEALGILLARGTPYKAVLIGDGREHETVKARARALGLTRWVRFPGTLTQPQVLRTMRRAALVALPCVVDRNGNQDALPTVLLEGAACGLAAVGTRVAGVPEIIHDRVTGRVVAPGDAEALADAIAFLMSSPRRRARMGAAARRRAGSLFDQRRASRSLARLFAESSRSSRITTRLQEFGRAHRSAVF